MAAVLATPLAGCSSHHSAVAVSEAKGGCLTVLQLTGVPLPWRNPNVTKALSQAAGLDHRFDDLLAKWNRWGDVMEREISAGTKPPKALPTETATAFFAACDRLLGRQPPESS